MLFMKRWLIGKLIDADKNRPRNIDIRMVKKIIKEFFPFAFYQFIYSIPHAPIDKSRPADTFFSLSFDCDLCEDYEAMPILLKALKNRSIKASFACIGRWIEKLPNIHRQMIEAGHEIINHTFTHPENRYFNPDKKFIELTYLEKYDEIARFDEIAWKILKYKAVGFRTPHFGSNHSPDVYKILRELGYAYSSSQLAIKSDKLGEPYRLDTLWEFPLSIDPGKPFTCFDTWTCFKGPSGKHTEETEEAFFSRLETVIKKSISNRLYINVYFDPADIMLFPRFNSFLDMLVSSDVQVTPYRDMLTVLNKNSE